MERRWEFIAGLSKEGLPFPLNSNVFRLIFMGFHDWHGSGFGEVITFWLGREPDITNTDQDMTMQKIKSFTFSVVLAGVVLSPVQSLRAAEGDGKELNYQPFTLSLDASTLGLGASANWRFANHFGLRAGVNYLKFDVSFFEYDSQGPATTVVTQDEYDAKFRLQSESLALDIYPWETSSFHFSVGALFNQNQFTGVAKAKNDGSVYDFNGNSYLQSAVGDLTFQADQQDVCPFITIGGQFYFDKKKHWSLGGEIGVAYTGSPDVSLTPQNSGVVNPQDLEVGRKKVEDDAKDYKFYPIVKLSLNFSF